MRLKEVIQSKGLFQKDVADAIGVRRGTFNNYCAGIHEPPLEVLKAAADFLGVSVDYLLGGVEPKPLSRQTREVMYLPVVGEINAGNPRVIDENVLFYMPLPRRGVAEDWLALKVDGDSMDLAGIPSGSVAVFRRTPVAEDGTIVAARINDSATIKRFYQEGDSVLLVPQSSNPEHVVQRYNLKSEDFEILGVLSSVTRFVEGEP